MDNIKADNIRRLAAQAQEEIARAARAMQPHLDAVARLGPDIEAAQEAVVEMAASVDVEALQAALPTARELENLKRMQEDASRAAAIVQPHLAEFEKVLGPQFDEIRRTVDSARSGIDPETVAAIRDLAATIDTETLRQMHEAADLLSKNYELVAAELARAYASQEVDRSERSRQPTKVFEQRWKNDAGRALSVLSSLVDEDHATPTASLGPQLEGQDTDIAGLYYLRQLTQEQIGDIVKLSQPSIANRLKKIDAVVANHLLLENLQECAAAESWQLSFGRGLDVGGAELFVDLVAERSESSGGLLALEVKVVSDNTLWLPLAERVHGWSEYLQSQEPPVYRAHALYDLSSRSAYLCTDADLLKAGLKARNKEKSDDLLKFRDIRPFLPTSLSLNEALERAQS